MLEVGGHCRQPAGSQQFRDFQSGADKTDTRARVHRDKLPKPRRLVFHPPNVVAALIPGNDRMWNDASSDTSTVYVAYHDLATFNINVQRSNNGGLTYAAGAGEAIDAATLPAADSLSPTDTANTAAQIKVDHSACPSKGNLCVAFTAPGQRYG